MTAGNASECAAGTRGLSQTETAGTRGLSRTVLAWIKWLCLLCCGTTPYPITASSMLQIYQMQSNPLSLTSRCHATMQYFNARHAGAYQTTTVLIRRANIRSSSTSSAFNPSISSNTTLATHQNRSQKSAPFTRPIAARFIQVNMHTSPATPQLCTCDRLQALQRRAACKAAAATAAATADDLPHLLASCQAAADHPARGLSAFSFCVSPYHWPECSPVETPSFEPPAPSACQLAACLRGCSTRCVLE